MKRLLLMSLILTILVFSLPQLTDSGSVNAQPPEPAKTAEKLQKDEKREIRLLEDGKVRAVSVHDYLMGVVAAEMPAAFEPEALKAQAVAARSFLQRVLVNGSKHENADICADANCCQAYKNDAQLKKSWGKKFDAYTAKIKKAVEATDGKYLSYDGEPALAAFHSSSDGTTENSGAIWNELPYLTSVDTPETEKDVPNFVSTLSEKDIDFRDTILYARPEADMTGDADTWIKKTERDEAGRVESMVIGGEKFSGDELRKLFSLRSTDFDLEHKDGGFTFTVRGYGHGVGMSQYGANVMAKSGAGYKEILAHYYPGTQLS